MELMKKLLDEVPADGTPAGGSAPNSEPPASTPAATESSVASSNVDWGVIDSGDAEITEPPQEVAAPPSPKETPPVTKEEVAPAPKVETPPVQPAAPVASQPVQTPVATPASPAPPQPSNEDIQRQIQEGRTKFMTELEKLYTVDEADIPQLVADPEKVLPKMLAKAHMAVMDQVADYVAKVFPQMLENVQQTQTRIASTVESFYKEWPELNKPEYAETVSRTLSAYRQANRDAKAEDVIREGGLAALIGLRLPIPDRILKLHNAGEPPAKPNGGFTPVAPGSAPRGAPAAPSTNVFTLLAQEDLAEG